jgi:hypothetical protein
LPAAVFALLPASAIGVLFVDVAILADIDIPAAGFSNECVRTVLAVDADRRTALRGLDTADRAIGI